MPQGPRPGVHPSPRSQPSSRPTQPAWQELRGPLRSTQALCLLLSLDLSEESPIREAKLLLQATTS